MIKTLNLYFNRTIVECRCRCSKGKCKRVLILIEPQWNVDNIGKLNYFCEKLILIEPQWNVDEELQESLDTTKEILIEPQWNVDTRRKKGVSN